MMSYCFRCNKRLQKNNRSAEDSLLCTKCYSIVNDPPRLFIASRQDEDLVWDLLDAVHSHGCADCDELPRDLPEFATLADAIGYYDPSHRRNQKAAE